MEISALEKRTKGMESGKHVPLERNLMFDHEGRFGNTEDEIVKRNSRNAGNNSPLPHYFNLFFLMPPLSLFPLLTFEQVFSSMPAYYRQMKTNS